MARAPRSDPPRRSEEAAKTEKARAESTRQDAGQQDMGLRDMAGEYWRLWQRNLHPPLPRELTSRDAPAAQRRRETGLGA